MRSTQFISVLILSIAFAGAILSFFAYQTRYEAERTAYFEEQDLRRSQGKITFSGPYCYPDRHPKFLLCIIGLIGSSLALSLSFRFFAVSLPFSLATLGLLFVWYLDTQATISISEFPEAFTGLDRFFLKATIFDSIVVVLMTAVTTIQALVLARSILARRFSCKLP